MATLSAVPISVAKTVSGNSPYTLMLPIAASQTFKRGSVVILTAGLVTVAVAGSRAIVGVAAADAPNVASPTKTDVVPVWIACDDTVFAVSAGSGTAVAATAVADLGVPYGMNIAVGAIVGSFILDKAKVTSGTNTVWVVQDFDKRSNTPYTAVAGDTGGLLQVIFQPGVSLLNTNL